MKQPITVNVECQGACIESFECVLSVDQGNVPESKLESWRRMQSDCRNHNAEPPKIKAHQKRVGYSLENIKDMLHEEDCLKINKELKEYLDKRKSTPTTSTTKLDETAVQHCKDLIGDIMTDHSILPVLDVKGDLIKAIMTPDKLESKEYQTYQAYCCVENGKMICKGKCGSTMCLHRKPHDHTDTCDAVCRWFDIILFDKFEQEDKTPDKLKPDEEIHCDYRYTSCKYCGEMKPKTSLRSDGLCVVCAHGMNTTGSPPHEKLGPRDEIRRGYRYTPCKSCGEMKPKSMLAINGLCEDCEKRTTGTGFDESVKITIKK